MLTYVKCMQSDVLDCIGVRRRLGSNRQAFNRFCKFRNLKSEDIVGKSRLLMSLHRNMLLYSTGPAIMMTDDAWLQELHCNRLFQQTVKIMSSNFVSEAVSSCQCRVKVIYIWYNTMDSISVALLSTRYAAWSIPAVQQHLHHQLTNAQG